MRVFLPLLAAALLLPSSGWSAPTDAAGDTIVDALTDLTVADLSRAINEIATNAGRAAAAVATDLDRSLALGRALADVTAAGQARDAAALERAAATLSALAPTAPGRPRRDMLVQAARAGRWPIVDAGIRAGRIERLRTHIAKFGADHGTIAGAGLWLRLLELSASARCHGGSGPPQGPLLRPAPTQHLRERLAAFTPAMKADARAQRIAAHVESLAKRAVPPDGATVRAAEACQLKELAAKLP